MPKNSPAREAPVSFRPGRYRSLLAQRARPPHFTEGQVAKRDLARYYLLLADALAEVRLTKREASWLGQALIAHDVYVDQKGDPFRPEFMHPGEELLEVVKVGLSYDEELAGLSGPHQLALGRRVAAAVQEMTALQRAALLDALGRLPADREEQMLDPANWALIGVRLDEDSADDVPRVVLHDAATDDRNEAPSKSER